MMSSASMPKMAYSDRKKKRKTRKEQADSLETEYQKRLKRRQSRFSKGRESSTITGSN